MILKVLKEPMEVAWDLFPEILPRLSLVGTKVRCITILVNPPGGKVIPPPRKCVSALQGHWLVTKDLLFTESLRLLVGQEKDTEIRCHHDKNNIPALNIGVKGHLS